MAEMTETITHVEHEAESPVETASEAEHAAEARADDAVMYALATHEHPDYARVEHQHPEYITREEARQMVQDAVTPPEEIAESVAEAVAEAQEQVQASEPEVIPVAEEMPQPEYRSRDIRSHGRIHRVREEVR